MASPARVLEGRRRGGWKGDREEEDEGGKDEQEGRRRNVKMYDMGTMLYLTEKKNRFG